MGLGLSHRAQPSSLPVLPLFIVCTVGHIQGCSVTGLREHRLQLFYILSLTQAHVAAWMVHGHLVALGILAYMGTLVLSCLSNMSYRHSLPETVYTSVF